jgi:hypothetical protein
MHLKLSFCLHGRSVFSAIRLSALGCMFACSLFSGVSPAQQQWHADPVDKKLGSLSTHAKQWLSNPGGYTSEKERFNEYFNNYYFPDMTKFDETSLGRLGESRYFLFKKYLLATNNESLQSDLTALAYHKMMAIVANKDAAGNKLSPGYHPAVRYNAILILGMLDKQYGIETGAAKRSPKPLPDANAFLVKVVKFAADDVQLPPWLLLGALIGLDRHAQFHDGLPPENIPPMTAALVKFVSREKPLQELDHEADAWFRMRAAAALAKLGSVGDKNSVHNALIKLITTSKSLDDRCQIAGFLDRITYKDAKLDDPGTAAPLFALARDVAADEDKRAQEFQDQVGGGGSAPGRPMSRVGPEGAGGSTESEIYPRRQVLTRLTGLRLALNKVKPALATDTQKTVENVLKAIESARKVTENKDTAELKLAEAIRTMAATINKLVPAAEKPKAEKATAAT